MYMAHAQPSRSAFQASHYHCGTKKLVKNDQFDVLTNAVWGGDIAVSIG